MFVNLPKEIKKEYIVYLTIDKEKRFIPALNAHKLQCLFLFALGTGLRLGEILALTWDDINFDDKTVSVNKSIRQETIFNNKGEGKYTTIIQPPKTETSIRTVPIPSNIIHKLKQFKVTQNKERLSNCELYMPSDLVFTTPIGTPINIHLTLENHIAGY